MTDAAAALPATNQQILYVERPRGLPTPACFKLVTVPMARPGEGEVLVRNHMLSVDPYIRMRMEDKDSYAPAMKLGDVVVARSVGEVAESRDPRFHVGDWVVGRLGWQAYSLGRGADLQPVDVKLAPPSAWLGALGSTGITAWVGLMAIGQPKPGETVVVSAASGAVGSVVGQLARNHGCRAVGIAGGPAKCAQVVGTYGFDACVDYKAVDFPERLAAAVPRGVDVYFDNVAGPVLDAVLPLMNNFGRIPLCGLVSQYNATEPYGVRNLRELFNHRVTLRGFVLSDHKDLWPQATQALLAAYAAGQLQHAETVTVGLERTPQAFIDMLNGVNFGKQLVRL